MHSWFRTNLAYLNTEVINYAFEISKVSNFAYLNTEVINYAFMIQNEPCNLAYLNTEVINYAFMIKKSFEPCIFQHWSDQLCIHNSEKFRTLHISTLKWLTMHS